MRVDNPINAARIHLRHTKSHVLTINAVQCVVFCPVCFEHPARDYPSRKRCLECDSVVPLKDVRSNDDLAAMMRREWEATDEAAREFMSRTQRERRQRERAEREEPKVLLASWQANADPFDPGVT